jgi:anti-sigma B factor antagonist
MNVTTTRTDGIVLLEVHETRLTYPVLADFATAATELIEQGERRIIINLGSVGYVDSATIGCLMDLYRQATSAGGQLKLAGVQQRVSTMLTMTGAHHFLEVFADPAAAIASFGGR